MRVKLLCLIGLIALLVTSCIDPNTKRIAGRVVRTQASQPDADYSTTIVFEDGYKHEFEVLKGSITGKYCVIDYTSNIRSGLDSITHIDCE